MIVELSKTAYTDIKNKFNMFPGYKLISVPAAICGAVAAAPIVLGLACLSVMLPEKK